jgi:hypothetical protein
MEWAEIELRVFGAGDSAEGYFCHPEDGELHVLRLTRAGDGLELGTDRRSAPLREPEVYV